MRIRDAARAGATDARCQPDRNLRQARPLQTYVIEDMLTTSTFIPRRAATSGAFLVLCILILAGCSRQGDEPDRPTNARNVVLFIGDGMGVATVTAARIYDGQNRGMDGESHSLRFEAFPNVALVKTYNTNQQVPDSAGTATAILTGQKTRAGVINVAPEALRGSCEGQQTLGLRSLASQANARGLATGVVTTARLTHATPATMYAQSVERNWESDRYVAEGCRDIAVQLIDDDHGAGLVVAMGGDRRNFFGSAGGGRRTEAGADLPADWLAAAPDRRYVTTAAEMRATEPGQRVLGLFSQSHMTYMAERTPDTEEPTLTEMATHALELLQEDPDGFFLMVESGRIDHGHHDGKPGYALTETQEFNRAIEAVMERVNPEETLVLVTADHSHVFTMGGYATRGNPILGLVVRNDEWGQAKSTPELADDGQPYTTLGYYNGPGAVRGSRTAPDTGVDAVAQALVPIRYLERDGSYTYDESHGGEDVAVYAIGPGSNQVRGVMEQNRLYDVMADALGISDPQ